MNDKKFVVITLAAIFVFIVGAYFLIPKGEKDTSNAIVASYKSSDKEKPQANVGETLVDLGTIKVSDEKTENFTIKNVGSRPLQLSNVKSSCMCTTGQIIYEGSKSQEYGMHAASDFLEEVAPGKEAVVRVTYRPYQMPVSGFVEREVYVTTNDPENPQLIFKVTANVQ